MTRYPQTLSLTAAAMLAVSCSLPVLRQSPPEPAARDEVATSLPPKPAPSTQFDFHRIPRPAACPPNGCRKPTLKTLAVDHQPPAATSWHQPRTAATQLPEALAVIASATTTGPSTTPRRPAVETIETELSIHFRHADASLAPEARARLNEVLRDRASLKRISIRGRTAGLGTSPANERLARARADAVRQHLLAQDPSLATLIEVEARGSCCFAGPNATASGRALNRRVEITFVRQASDA